MKKKLHPIQIKMIKNKPISCLSELFDFVSENAFFWENDKLLKNSKQKNKLNRNAKNLWYRGHKSSNYILVPSLYRKMVSLANNKIKKNDLKSKEDLLLDEFSTRNYFRFQYKLPENEFLWMSIMQHHNVSTRLLDWSESLITALFFSVEDYFKDRNYKTENVPCVWVLNPYLLNYGFLPYSKSTKINGIIKSNNIPSLLTKNIFRDLNKSGFPLAVKSPTNSERIQKQSGVFCLFPLKKQKSNEFLLRDGGLENLHGSDQYLMKFTLIEPQRISDELKLIGVKRSMYIPELAETSHEIEEFILR